MEDRRMDDLREWSVEEKTSLVDILGSPLYRERKIIRTLRQKREMQMVMKKSRIAGCYGNQANKESFKKKGETAAKE